MGENLFSVPALRDIVEGKAPPQVVHDLRVGETGPGSVELSVWPPMDPWNLEARRREYAGWLGRFSGVAQLRGSLIVRVSNEGFEVLLCTLPPGQAQSAIVDALSRPARNDHFDLKRHVGRWQLARRVGELETHVAAFWRDTPEARSGCRIELRGYTAGENEKAIVDLSRPFHSPDITCVVMSAVNGPMLVALSPESFCLARGGLFHSIFADQVMEALRLHDRAVVVPAPRVIGPNGPHSFVLSR